MDPNYEPPSMSLTPNTPTAQTDAAQTDAQFAAAAAAAALEQGRFELGRALAALAAQAYRAERTAEPRMVPMIGAAREEHPGQTADLYANGPTGNGDQDITAAEQQTAALPGARCATEVGHGAYREQCQRPVFWHVGNIGDQDHPATIAGWYHVDPALDQDHMPTVEHDPGAR